MTRRAIAAAAGVLALLSAPSVVPLGSGRTEVGHPVAGIVAVIDASAPRDDIFNGQFCGGALVAADLVLTAAHCVADRSPTQIEVVVGADNLCRGRPIDGRRVAVERIALHPEYGAPSRRFDLALLTLGARFTDAPHAMAHPPRGGHRQLTAVGWGRAMLAGVPSCRLMRIGLELLEAPLCRQALGPGFDAASMICAIPENSGQDVCIGDSGGPVLVGASLDEAAIVALVSWGRGCGAGIPGAYARAASVAVALQDECCELPRQPDDLYGKLDEDECPLRGLPAGLDAPSSCLYASPEGDRVFGAVSERRTSVAMHRRRLGDVLRSARPGPLEGRWPGR
jgi:trypsin